MRFLWASKTLVGFTRATLSSQVVDEDQISDNMASVERRYPIRTRKSPDRFIQSGVCTLLTVFQIFSCRDWAVNVLQIDLGLKRKVGQKSSDLFPRCQIPVKSKGQKTRFVILKFHNREALASRLSRVRQSGPQTLRETRRDKKRNYAETVEEEHEQPDGSAAVSTTRFPRKRQRATRVLKPKETLPSPGTKSATKAIEDKRARPCGAPAAWADVCKVLLLLTS